MREFKTIWYENSEGPKGFHDDKRIQIYEIPKDSLERFKTLIKEDFKKPGIYILLGESEEGSPVAYVGESDNISSRIKDHIYEGKKDFMNKVIFILSTNSNYPFSKTELHYLERQLINKFKNSEFEVRNRNVGQGKEPSIDQMIKLDEELRVINTGLESFGIKLEEDISASKVVSSKFFDKTIRGDIDVYIKVRNSDTVINGVYHPNGSITILGGQGFNGEARPNKDDQAMTQRYLSKTKLLSTVEVIDNFPKYEIKYLQDTTFKTPSAAATIIKGGAPMPYKEWKDKKDNKGIDKFRKY